MKTNFRTNYCATFNESNQGEEVSITGWSSTVRDHGGVIFIDVRDRSGIIQIVSDPELFPEAHNTIEKIRNEFVINVKGKIRLRSDNSVNPKLPTGKIEICANHKCDAGICVLSEDWEKYKSDDFQKWNYCEKTDRYFCQICYPFTTTFTCCDTIQCVLETKQCYNKSSNDKLDFFKMDKINLDLLKIFYIRFLQVVYRIFHRVCFRHLKMGYY